MTKELPSPELLRKLLRYEPETGKLFWMPRPLEMFATKNAFGTWNTRWANAEAFTSIDGRGYKQGHFSGKHLRAHRVVWAVHFGSWPKNEIDHINGNRSDNRIENLRDVPHRDNMKNMSVSRANTSGQIGVDWSKKDKCWRAFIGVGGSRRYLGSFIEKHDAISARKRAEIEMGYHPNHGRTTCPTAKGYTR